MNNMRIQKLFFLLKNDFSGTFFFYSQKIYLIFMSEISSIIFYLKAKLMGIKLGHGIKTFKVPIIERHPLSHITVGDKCVFRSSEKSNLVGLNRKCIINTRKSNAYIKIGNNCGFSGTVIAAFLGITICNNVRCGANTLITDSDWHNDDPRTSPPKEVIIEDNVWLGLNVVVLKGVRIGKNTVIGANSVVTKSIPDNVIAAGNPCRVIKKLYNK